MISLSETFRAETSCGSSGSEVSFTVSLVGDALSATGDMSRCASRFGNFKTVAASSLFGDFVLVFVNSSSFVLAGIALPDGVTDGFVILLDRPLKLRVGWEDLCALFVPCLLEGMVMLCDGRKLCRCN